MHAAVTGRVQGVGFRYFTARAAGNHGLHGWVRNRRDGSVELVAEGPPQALARFNADLQRGPAGSFVAGVEIRWEPATGEFDDFSIRKTV